MMYSPDVSHFTKIEDASQTPNYAYSQRINTITMPYYALNSKVRSPPMFPQSFLLSVPPQNRSQTCILHSCYQFVWTLISFNIIFLFAWFCWTLIDPNLVLNSKTHGFLIIVVQGLSINGPDKQLVVVATM